METEYSWSQLLTELTSSPLNALNNLVSTMSQNFLEKWWQLVLVILFFLLARKIAFMLVDFIVPRSLNQRHPKWMLKSKTLTIWRDKIYHQSLESRRLNRAKAVVSLLKSFIDPVMGFILFLTVFDHLGVTTSQTTVTWIIGGFSIGLGLALQGVIKDIIAGITVLVTDSYAVGDYIDVQFGAAGVVRHIGLRLTELEGNDGTIWFVRHSEIPKIGNRTASRGVIVTDIKLTWHSPDKLVNMADLKFAETTLDATVRNLGETLRGVDRVSRDLEAPSRPVSTERIATVVPDLVPTMGADTLWSLRAITADDNNAKSHLNVQEAVQKIPGRVPIFTCIETLGVVNSSKDSVTLRLRITLPPQASRAQGMAALRRSIFEAFVAYQITPSFEDAPDGIHLLTDLQKESAGWAESS